MVSLKTVHIFRTGLRGTRWTQTSEGWALQVCCNKFQDFWQGKLSVGNLAQVRFCCWQSTCNVCGFFCPVNSALCVCLNKFWVHQVREGPPVFQVLSHTNLLVRNNNTTCACCVNLCMQRNVKKKRKTEHRPKLVTLHMYYTWFEWIVIKRDH